MRLVWLVAGLACAPLATLEGQEPTAKPAGDRARALLESALAAHGGRARFEAVTAVEADAEGEAWMIGQSVRPDGPLDVEPARTTTRYHRLSGRMRQDATNDYPPDFRLTFREVIGKQDGFVIEPTRAYQGGRLDRTAPDALASRRAALLRDMGPFLLPGAVDRGTGMEVLEPDGAIDRVALDDGLGRFVLRLDGRTHLLDGFELVWQHAVAGRQAHRVQFAAYRPIKGLLLPTTRHDTWNGSDAARWRLGWQFDVATDDSVFAEPRDFREATLPATVTAVGPGVHRLTFMDGSSGLAVEFADHLVVVEAPGGSSASEAMLAALAATFPSKPVRYVAFSHHHTDHAAGLRAYIARGITVISPEAYAPFVRQLASTAYPLVPDSLSLAPVAPVIQTFRGRHALSDATRRLELYEIPNSHSLAMVVAFEPVAGVLFDGDGLVILNDTAVRPAYQLMRELVAALEQLGVWPKVVTIVNTHAGLVAPARVREALGGGR